jgi:ribose transport system substrate-binding protein
MSTSKAWIAGAAVLTTAALVAGCSSSGSASPGTGGSSQAASSGKLGKVVYIPGLTGNPFYNTVACGAETEAKKLGVSFSYQGSSTFSVADQTKVLNSVVATKPGAIMISITDPVAMYGPLEAAKRAGIKIIAIDGDLNNKSVMITNIQSDGVAGGKQAGEALAKAVGYKGDVMAIDNATGSTVAEARTNGFQEAIKQYPKMKFLGIQYTNNDVSKAATIASTAATNDKNLVGIFGVETNNTEGALTGIREANKTSSVKIVGYDSSDPIVAALKNGTLTGTVVQYPRYEGMTGVQDAVDAMEGKSVPRDQSAPDVFATPQNVNSPTVQKYIYDVNCKG